MHPYNAGLMGTVWVNPEGKPLKEGQPQATYTVKDVGELPAIVDQLLAKA